MYIRDRGSSSSGKEGAAADGKAAELQLTEAGKEFLRKMCYCLPEFSDPAEMDDEFWHEFISVSYTHLDVYKRQISNGKTVKAIVWKIKNLFGTKKSSLTGDIRRHIDGKH